MILLFLAIGFGAGLALGGRIGRLVDVRLRWVALIFLALALRVGTEWAIGSGVQLADTLRLPLYAAAFTTLAVAMWLNRNHAGLLVVAVGAVANGVAVVVNGGWMPVWEPSLAAVGMTVGDLNTAFHRPLDADFDLEFFLRAGPLADIIPLPLPLLSNVASIGDVFLGLGLGWFVFSTMLRGYEDPAGGVSLGRGPRTAAENALGLERPVLLGSGRGPATALPLPAGARLRDHPFVRLAQDPRFVAYWLSQTISLFGDRLHQVALGVLVYALTDSPLLTGLVFLVATVPNIVLGPIAGTFVDRWEHKTVMIVSDVLRAGLVLLLPLAAFVEIMLVYPLVFLITTVSLFFRPAKVALVPRIVRRDDLLAANSATWTADTLADIAGFPIAGLFVAFLLHGDQVGDLHLAFFVDSATYLLGALLLVGIQVPPLARAAAPRVAGALASFVRELREGWHFLRGQPPLIQNTLVSAVAQMSVGVTLALMVVFARDTLDGSVIPYPENYAAVETAIGLGNLLGGLAVGFIGTRLRKGWLVVAGFIGMGLATIFLGLTSNVIVALAAAALIGIANLVYIIPTQTIFIELTPLELMGRVVAFRSSLVFGSMTGAMGVAGILAEQIPVGLVIAAFGVLTAMAGFVGALLPHVRDPDTTRPPEGATQPLT
ncbi:MAG TPA: MFS transporter [Candidatus Limnocylindria bacterium]|nr:MFS transporter [Candidatus Limnocylindria bacterium]